MPMRRLEKGEVISKLTDKFRDADGEFEGAIVEVEDDGHLILRDSKGMIREYQFKEVEFIIN